MTPKECSRDPPSSAMPLNENGEWEWEWNMEMWYKHVYKCWRDIYEVNGSVGFCNGEIALRVVEECISHQCKVATLPGVPEKRNVIWRCMLVINTNTHTCTCMHTTHTHLLSVLRPLLFFSSHPCLMASCFISNSIKTSLRRIAQRRIQPWRLLPW